jgi:glutaminyl-peptide cyclotransferase
MASKPITKYVVYFIIAAILFGLIATFSPGKKKELRFPDIVVSPDVNAAVASGSELTIKFNEEKLSGVDSVIVKFSSDHTDVNGTFSHTINTTGLPLGYHVAEITVHDGKKSKTVALPFVVTSDINPSQASFTKLSQILHDKKSYTQGLEFYNGIIYESTGQYKESTVRKVNPKTGQTIKTVPLSSEFFGEGLTVLKNKVYQITWKEATCFVYDDQLNLLKKNGFRTTSGEGWGLTNDGNSLIVSDGTNKLTYINPETFAVEKIVSVYAGANEVQYLNELEYVDGHIYANIYTTNQIAKIEANTGKVVNVYDLATLKNENQDGEVLNGIAYNPASKTFFVTGKYWGKMYEVKL